MGGRRGRKGKGFRMRTQPLARVRKRSTMAPMSRLGLLTPVILIVLAAPLARAAGTEAKERAARKACLSGDYAKGVEILSDLFIDTKDATHIFNQARCFEQNNRCEEAVSRFREYLRKATAISPEDKADAEKHITDCQALLGQKPAPEPKSVAAAPVPAAPSPPPAAVLPVAAVPEQVVVANETSSPGRGLRIAGIGCGVLGVASVGAGVYYYTQAKSYSNKVAGQGANPNPADASAGKHAQTMQWVFYSTGAAAIATGTVLYVLGWPSSDAGRVTTGVAPMFGPGVAGISAQGAF
jgi:hypothetical protein